MGGDDGGRRSQVCLHPPLNLLAHVGGGLVVDEEVLPGRAVQDLCEFPIDDLLSGKDLGRF